jgi:hypothetical protein
LVELTCDEFCRHFTDDDLLKHGTAAVKDAINDGCGFVVVNSEVRDRELAVVNHSRQINFQET